MVATVVNGASHNGEVWLPRLFASVIPTKELAQGYFAGLVAPPGKGDSEMRLCGLRGEKLRPAGPVELGCLATPQFRKESGTALIRALIFLTPRELSSNFAPLQMALPP